MKKILKAALVLFVPAIAIVSITAVCKYVERKNFYECINGTVEFLNNGSNNYEIVKYDFQNKQEVRELKDCPSLKTWTLNKHNDKLYAVSNHTSGKSAEVIAADENTAETLHALKKHVFSGTFKGDKMYMITESDPIYELSELDLSDGKETLICSLSSYAFGVFCSTDKIYFPYEGAWRYTDMTNTYTCPDTIKTILAVSDSRLASYDWDNYKLEIFDVQTWEKLYSFNVNEKPFASMFNQDSTKLIFCELDRWDEFAGNRDCFYLLRVIDFEQGKVYKYNVKKRGMEIFGFLNWTENDDN